MTTLSPLPIGREVELMDRYLLEEGRVTLTGVQALVRLVFDQMRADRRAGLNTGALVSGYPGSPLGGLDLEIARQRELRESLRVVHVPAINEELGATAVWGSQVVPQLREARVDGVLGVWYGKAPGVDRAGDALRHGNFSGAHPKGGMLALCGDDATCKSSTLPSESESGLAALRMPVVFPGNPAEVLELGRHAIAGSRASGLWFAVKMATNVADAVMTVDVCPDLEIRPVSVEYDGARYVHAPSGSLFNPFSLEMERTLVGPRMELARAYARVNGLNRVVLDGERPWLGLVAAGTSYYDLREALHTLGLSDADLRRLGVRILKLGMIWPLDSDTVREFSRELEEIVVIEDKGPFVETGVRDALYDLAERPRVLGKRDEHGEELLPASGLVEIDTIARAIGSRLLGRGDVESIRVRLEQLASPVPAAVPGTSLRLACFCSGCPHNRSTDAPDDALVGAGIGCHAMALGHPKGKGTLTGITQMGGEGVPWIGQAPFVSTPHMFQNLGDGTFHHSGSLAVRAAAAAGVNITFKILYNRGIAMTGAQDVPGAMPVPELTRWLQIEGARRIIVTTDEPDRYRGARLAGIAEVRPRSELMAAQEELRRIEGLTVLIHDQQCAAQKRRLRKRGKLPDPSERMFINERVCEGCGDCGQKSHCISLLPTETEFGRKTRIEQSSCNKDYSCVDGDCPSFIEVVPGSRLQRDIPAPPAGMPEPDARPTNGELTLRLIGIGGTGVVTISQVMGMAAMLDGKRAVGLDQTGLAQKGGPVVSDLRFLRADNEVRANRAPSRTVDGYLAFDVIGAVDPLNLQRADPDRTIAVVSTYQSPTADMVGDPSAQFGALTDAIEAIERVTRADRNVYLDAPALSDVLFGDRMPANSIVLGAAWQLGLIPLSLRAIEEAYRLNGAAVQRNIAAFHWGRAVVANPDAVARVSQRQGANREPSPDARRIAERVRAQPDSELHRLVLVRVEDLIGYQGRRYAEKYADFVVEVFDRERETRGTHVSEAVARGLHKLMAYKDEYEVARLHLDPTERRRIIAQFGEGTRIRYKLHPPILRALGMNRKVSVGRWFDPAFGLMHWMRFLRGTPFDPFGYTPVRQLERTLVDEYRTLVRNALPSIATDPATVIAICELPDVVRGYESVKLRNIEAFRKQAAQLTAELSRQGS
ncbi:MAG TPA: indolepyruvate ferredoxin oxidoreductase family protein [Solirubrobacteraceae bacterium]|nr:indolepyruvate ferredoxin oxidoreductase family protein [Solirubrobacteraceae bacterium]